MTDKYLTREMSFQPSAMYNDDEETFEGPDDEEDFEFEPIKKTKKFSSLKGDEEDEENETESESDDDENDDNFQVEGSYDPREFDHLSVDSDVSNLFLYIQKYQAQSIILDYKLKPFIPDFIPAVGDIDAFLKVCNTVVGSCCSVNSSCSRSALLTALMTSLASLCWMNPRPVSLTQVCWISS